MVAFQLLTNGFTWTAREGNTLAHMVAALASRDLLPPNWFFNQPLVVKKQIEKDNKEFIGLRRPNWFSIAHF